MGKYSKEFKRDALRVCEREGIRAASEKLGVPQKALYAWRREERLERGEAPKGLRQGETAEQGFKRLEHELEELREANYILKKAMGFVRGHHGLNPQHLQAFLAEFCFRFNRRFWQDQLFARTLCACVHALPFPRAKLLMS